MKALRVLAALVLLGLATGSVRGAEPGVSGIASHYGPGSGVAMHFCTWELRHGNGCGWVRIQSADTGIVVEAPVIDYCECVVPDSSHPVRIADLQWGVVDALGLDRSTGLYRVTLWLIPDGPAFLSDTAAAEPGDASILIVVGLAGAPWAIRRLVRRQRRPRPFRGSQVEEIVGWLE